MRTSWKGVVEARLFMIEAHEGLMSVEVRNQLYGHWPLCPHAASGVTVGGWVLPQFSTRIGRPLASIRLAQ